MTTHEKTMTNPILLEKGDLIDLCGTIVRIADHPTVVNSVVHIDYRTDGGSRDPIRTFHLELPAYIIVDVLT